MTKLCMIGNSHVAAMRNAWNTVAADYPGLDVDIFAQHAKHFANATLTGKGALAVEGPRLWRFRAGSDDNRCSEINLANYDAVILVALAFGANSVFRHYRKYHWYGMKGRRQQGLTRENFRKAAQSDAEATAALHLAALIQPAANVPLFLVPAPLPSERGYDDEDMPGMIAWRAAAENGDAEALMAMYDEILAGIGQNGVVIVAQPEDSKANFRATLQRYADNAARTHNDGIRPENDYFHMNDEYGALIWRGLVQALRRANVIGGNRT